MSEGAVHKDVAHDYLETLRQVQEQYQQYVEVADLYKLPIQGQTKTPKYVDPSVEQPLTVNSLRFQ
jgi:hypothetical protein